MGDCTYCGDSAGIFKHEHQECADAHASAIDEIRELAARTALGKNAAGEFRGEAERMAKRGFVRDGERAVAVSEGFTHAVNMALEDHLLTEEEDAALDAFLDVVGKDTVDSSAVMRQVMGAALRDVMEGRVPERLKLEGPNPFNLEADEQLVWVWAPVKYGEEVTHRTRVGGYGGPSVRIARGVYWKMGASVSQSVAQTALEMVDSGGLAATTEHLYFKGAHRALKIPYSKIVAFDEYTDGIGIMQGNKTSKPQVFVTGEGWFIYNLVRNLAQMQGEDMTAPTRPSGGGADGAKVLGFAAK